MAIRLQEFDIAKGIAILMVMFIHTLYNFGLGNLNQCYKFVVDIIYCSYISTFFISAGIFAHRETWRSFIEKKGKNILVPFFVFYILGILIVPVVNLIPGLHTHSLFSWNEFFSIYYSHGSRNGALWFLMALFNAFLFLQVVIRVNNKWLQILCALFIFGIGRWEQFLPQRFPFYIGSSCMAFGYVYLGYVLKESGIILFFKQKKWIIFLFVISFLFVVLNRHNQQFMKYNYVTGPFSLTILTGIMGAISILAFSTLIKRNKYLEYCGRTTLPILCVHSLFTQVVCRVTMHYMDATSWVTPIVSFLIVVACSHLAAEFLLRYTPFIVGKSR